MDEFLNEILDKIFEVVAKMDSGELIESFSKLFKELLYSDYREAFIGRCEKEVITCNSNLLNNLIFLLVSNSWDREINKILLSILGTNEENIFKAIYQIIWKNYPFQNTKVYKENFKNYLSYLKSQNDEIGLNKAMHNFILMESKGTYWRPEPEEFIRIIDQFLGTELFDIFLAYCVNDCMYNSIPFNQYAPKGKPFYNLYQLIERYSDNVLAKNLDTSLEVMDSFVVPFFSSAQSIKFVLNHHNVILAYYDNKIINIVFWSRSFDNIFHDSISVTDIPSYLKGLKSRFSVRDIEIIEWQIFNILGPQKGADTENALRFIKTYNNRKLYISHEWQKFSIIKINLNPSIFSKIIVQYGDQYLRTEMLESEILERKMLGREMFDKKELSLKSFDDEAICPPAKLLFYYIMKIPFNQKMLDESIAYFRACPPEVRMGAFSVLYTILNPFEFAG